MNNEKNNYLYAYGELTHKVQKILSDHKEGILLKDICHMIYQDKCDEMKIQASLLLKNHTYRSCIKILNRMQKKNIAKQSDEYLSKWSLI